jgi:hypothetical protein
VIRIVALEPPLANGYAMSTPAILTSPSPTMGGTAGATAGDPEMKIFPKRPTVEVPELLVVDDDPISAEALALVRRKNVRVQVVRVSKEDYLTPRDVPKLMTKTGIYFGLPSIARIIDEEFTSRRAS